VSGGEWAEVKWKDANVVGGVLRGLVEKEGRLPRGEEEDEAGQPGGATRTFAKLEIRGERRRGDFQKMDALREGHIRVESDRKASSRGRGERIDRASLGGESRRGFSGPNSCGSRGRQTGEATKRRTRLDTYTGMSLR
jgi:hypothetical protein